MAYNPLDDGLPYSTVNRQGGPTVLAVWSLILSTSANREGITKLTPAAIETLWQGSREPVSVEQIQGAWDFLAAPDPESANREEDGRRIVPTGDGRWRVVSHERYRERYAEERRRAQWRGAQQRRRVKLPTEPAPQSAEPRVRVVDSNGRPRPAFEPSDWYETQEAWEADVRALLSGVRETAETLRSAGASDADAATIMAQASRFRTRDGWSSAKINPRTMTHERLKLTLQDARASLARARAALAEHRGRAIAAEMQPKIQEARQRAPNERATVRSAPTPEPEPSPGPTPEERQANVQRGLELVRAALLAHEDPTT